jgi:hypothetical protein
MARPIKDTSCIRCGKEREVEKEEVREFGELWLSLFHRLYERGLGLWLNHKKQCMLYACMLMRESELPTGQLRKVWNSMMVTLSSDWEGVKASIKCACQYESCSNSRPDGSAIQLDRFSTQALKSAQFLHLIDVLPAETELQSIGEELLEFLRSIVRIFVSDGCDPEKALPDDVELYLKRNSDKSSLGENQAALHRTYLHSLALFRKMPTLAVRELGMAARALLTPVMFGVVNEIHGKDQKLSSSEDEDDDDGFEDDWSDESASSHAPSARSANVRVPAAPPASTAPILAHTSSFDVDSLNPKRGWPFDALTEAEIDEKFNWVDCETRPSLATDRRLRRQLRDYSSEHVEFTTQATDLLCILASRVVKCAADLCLPITAEVALGDTARETCSINPLPVGHAGRTGAIALQEALCPVFEWTAQLAGFLECQLRLGVAAKENTPDLEAHSASCLNTLVLSLLRGAAGVHRDSVPPVQLPVFKHVMILSDMVLYVVHHLHDIIQPIENRESTPCTSHTSVQVDAFFARTGSTTTDGSVSMPQFHLPLEKSLPLAKNPTLLRPEIVGMIGRLFAQTRDHGGDEAHSTYPETKHAWLGRSASSDHDGSAFIERYTRSELMSRWRWGLHLLLRHFWADLRQELSDFLLSGRQVVTFKHKAQQWRRLCRKLSRRPVNLRVERQSLIASSVRHRAGWRRGRVRGYGCNVKYVVNMA